MRLVIAVVLVACGKGGGTGSCEPTGTWRLQLEPARLESGVVACTDAFALAEATLDLEAAGNPGRAKWQGVAAEKAVVFDDAGTWDFTVFPADPSAGELSLLLRARGGKVIEGQLIRQRKQGDDLCTQHFHVTGSCKQ